MLAQTRTEIIARIKADVEASLLNLAPLEKSYRHTATPLITTVEVSDVKLAPEAGPTRQGSVSYPGFSGYSPAGVFRTVVERSRKKARKRQAQATGASVRILAVYLMGTQIAKDLNHPAHLNQATAALDAVELLEHGLDAIVFLVRTLPQGLGAIVTLADDTNVTAETIQAMFSAQ